MSSGLEALSVLRFASIFRIPFVSIRRSVVIGYLHLRFSGILWKISCTFSIHSWPRRKGDSCEKTDCLFKILAFSLFSVTRIFLDLSVSDEIPCKSCLAFLISE